MAAVDPEQFFAELDLLGEEKTRINLANRIYGADKQPLVAEWLKRKDEPRRETSHAAELEIAQSAKDAAWAAADAARDAAAEAKEANRIAKRASASAHIATIAALISSIMSIVALLVAFARP